MMNLLSTAAFAGAGPGAGEWQTMDPAKFGLDAAALKAAAEMIAERVPQRYCTLIVKDGYLIHETYHANTSDTLYESDSMGKLATAAVIGVANAEGLIDIDKPMAEYGVPRDMPDATWNSTGTDFFPTLTARHAMAQTTGYGRVAPGSYFTYNSDSYIQYLSYLLRNATNNTMTPQEFATTHFAKPLGVPDLYKYDGSSPSPISPVDPATSEPGEISAGGGQLYTCRDAARIGQLVASGGLWADEAGKPYQLMTQEFSKGFWTPQFPKNNAAYGFLTWLNSDVTKVGNGDVPCCGPRWGHAAEPCIHDKNTTHCARCCAPRGGTAKADTHQCNTSSTSLQEDDADAVLTPGENPDDWMVRVGSAQIDKTMISDNLPPLMEQPFSGPEDLNVAMGWCARYIVTVPSQNLTIVSMGTSEGWSDGCWGGYDDSFSIALIWASLAKALEVPADFVQHPDVAKTRVPLPPRARPTRESLIPPGHPSSHQHEAPPPGETWLGSCACACGPGQGYGKCFNVASGSPPPKAGDCSSFKSDPTSFYNRQRDFCPQAGFPVQCNYPADATTDLCTPKDHPRDGNCTQISACSPMPGVTGLATAACSCDGSVDFGHSCSWSDKPCTGNPYFPPGMAVGNRGGGGRRKRMVY